MDNFVVTSVMSVLMALPSLIKLIKEAMTTAQDAFEKGKGAEKKDAVLSGLQAVITDETVWEKVKGMLSAFIDFIAIFKKKE